MNRRASLIQIISGQSKPKQKLAVRNPIKANWSAQKIDLARALGEKTEATDWANPSTIPAFTCPLLGIERRLTASFDKLPLLLLIENILTTLTLAIDS